MTTTGESLNTATHTGSHYFLSSREWRAGTAIRGFHGVAERRGRLQQSG